MRQLNSRSVRHGFTFVELIVVMCLGLVLSAAVVSAAVSSRERANRIKCAANLRQIGQGCMLYANENNSFLPRTLDDVGSTDKPTAFTGANSADPWKGPAVNDVSAAMFLIVRNEDLSIRAFVCPATKAKAWDFGDNKDAQHCSNWPEAKYLSYSYRNPYASPAAVNGGFKAKITPDMNKDIAWAADGNPGSDDLLHVTAKSSEAEMAKANSYNHGGAGQNVLYSDGRVEWQATPFCGVEKDNIYTYGTGEKSDGIIGSPANAMDTVLLPVIPEMK